MQTTGIKYKFPHIGLRIVKSAVSVGLCFLIYVIRGFQGIPFYTALACLQCIQPYRENTKEMALQRTFGTFLGGFYGLIVILIQTKILNSLPYSYFWYTVLVSLGVAGALYTAVLFHRKNAAYFSCVVFLSIVMIHIADSDPYRFVYNRVLDTMIGIAVGMIVNLVHLPRTKKVDTLFITGLDDVLFRKTGSISDYSRVDLNRMLDDGLPLSVMTMRTTASFLEAVGQIRLRLPVIVMNGAAIYDPVKHSYPVVRAIPHHEAEALCRILRGFGAEPFSTVIKDDSVLIFYEKINNDGARQIYEKLRVSPFRNYLHMSVPEDMDTLYLMIMDTKQAVSDISIKMSEAHLDENYRIWIYDSDEYPGYAYIKIYRKDVDKLSMLETLKELTGYQQVLSFGSIPGMYDRQVKAESGSELVRMLQKEFEPLCSFR